MSRTISQIINEEHCGWQAAARIHAEETFSGGGESRPAKQSLHFSSESDEWPTPIAFFNSVAKEHGPFDLDACATKENAKASTYFTKADDGLSKTWTGRVWMNPPYGRTIGSWMRKAYESSLGGAFVVCLVPARTDTSWWHDYAAKGAVTFIRGRLKFGNAKHSAPFPSALVIFNPQEVNREL